MYIPKNFKRGGLKTVREFIYASGFAILIKQVDNRLWATYIS